MLPLLDLKRQFLALEKQIQLRMQNVLQHTQFILGPEVQECEKNLAEFVGSRFALSVGNGTDALIMALMAYGIGPGDEVITTPFTFFATAEAISLVGAKPVFVDIDAQTYNIDVQKISSAITAKTKAIIPVSLYGLPADMDEINDLAQRHNLFVIEDAAQSFGAPYKGKRSGHLSSIGVTSFFPAKPLGCYGDGGGIFTDDEKLYQKLVQIRVHGQEKRYHHVVLGLNARLDTLQCAILIEKLKRYPWEIEARNRIAAAYSEAFASLQTRGIHIPYIPKDRQSVWAQYTLRVPKRDLFAEELKKEGVATAVHYPMPLHKQPVYAAQYTQVHLPVAEKLANEVLSLPLFPDMTIDEIRLVTQAVPKALERLI